MIINVDENNMDKGLKRQEASLFLNRTIGLLSEGKNRKC
jgi:hypothetical protein